MNSKALADLLWRGIHRSGRVCCGCRICFQRVVATSLCQDCLGKTLRSLSRGPSALRINGREFPIYSMFLWKPWQDESLSRLAWMQKGQSFLSWRIDIIKKFGSINGSDFWLPPETCKVVPAPLSPGKWRNNHALAWAQALIELLPGKFQMLDILKVPTRPWASVFGSQGIKLAIGQKAKGQKAQRRRERQQKSLGLELSQQVSLPASVLFVDDIVTTGSTAYAAWRTLGCPPDFRIFCFAFREKEDNFGTIRDLEKLAPRQNEETP